MRRLSALTAMFALLISMTGQASARILFQNDAIFEVEGETLTLDFDNNNAANDKILEFGNSGTDGTITWDQSATEFLITDDVNFDGKIDASDSSEFHIREVADVTAGGSVACTTVGEIVLDLTTDGIYVCTTAGAAGVAVWQSADNNPADGTTDNAVLKWDAGSSTWVEQTGVLFDDSDNVSIAGTTTSTGLITATAGIESGGNVVSDTDSTDDLGTTGVRWANIFADGFTGNTITLDGGTGVNAFDITDNAADALSITHGGTDFMVFDTTDAAEALTITPNTTISGALDANGQVDLGDGGDTVSITSSDWTIGATGDMAGIGSITADGDIDFSGSSEFHIREVTDITALAEDACTTVGEIVLDLTTDGIYVCTATGDPGTWQSADNNPAEGTTGGSTLRWDGSNWVESTALSNDGTDLTTTGDINLNGGDLITSAVTASLFNTNATTVNIAGAGTTVEIGADTGTTSVNNNLTVDKLTTLDGGITADGGVFTVADTNGDIHTSGAFDVDGVITAGSGNTQITNAAGNLQEINNFTEDNVLADNDAVYAALDKLDLKWGDLASTTNGEGASLTGVEDAGAYFNGTDVEAVLQEIGATVGSAAPETETMRFYPEYPDAVYDTNNQGKLEAEDDATEGPEYIWTTQQTTNESVVIVMRKELPTDFTDINDVTLRFKTLRNTTTNNSVALEMLNITDAETCGSVAAAASSVADTYETMTLSEATIETGCNGTLAAGDIVEFRVTLLANDGDGTTTNGEAHAAYMDMGYDN